jgi:hypothetical protein
MMSKLTAKSAAEPRKKVLSKLTSCSCGRGFGVRDGLLSIQVAIYIRELSCYPENRHEDSASIQLSAYIGIMVGQLL